MQQRLQLHFLIELLTTSASTYFEWRVITHKLPVAYALWEAFPDVTQSILLTPFGNLFRRHPAGTMSIALLNMTTEAQFTA